MAVSCESLSTSVIWHSLHCVLLWYRWVSARKCNSIANALELRLSCTNPSIHTVSYHPALGVAFLSEFHNWDTDMAFDSINSTCMLIVFVLMYPLSYNTIVQMVLSTYMSSRLRFSTCVCVHMLMSWHGNVLCVIGRLWGEQFTKSVFPAESSSNVEMLCFHVVFCCCD